MKLLVGLGNPGSQYQNNRHNVGFKVIDCLRTYFGGSNFREKFNGLITEVTLCGHKIILFKPQTFMNLSGEAIIRVLQFYKINSDDVIIFHDELDIDLGKVKYKFAGGAAGHNGLKNIDQIVGNLYHRIRIGIDHPGDRNSVSYHVLSDFDHDEQTIICLIAETLCKNLELLLTGDYQQFTQAINGTICAEACL